MKWMKDRVKKKHIHWSDVLLRQENLTMSGEYWLMRSKHPEMSKDRCAFYVLRRYYSTTAIAWYRKYGEWPR